MESALAGAMSVSESGSPGVLVVLFTGAPGVAAADVGRRRRAARRTCYKTRASSLSLPILLFLVSTHLPYSLSLPILLILFLYPPCFFPFSTHFAFLNLGGVGGVSDYVRESE